MRSPSAINYLTKQANITASPVNRSGNMPVALELILLFTLGILLPQIWQTITGIIPMVE